MDEIAGIISVISLSPLCKSTDAGLVAHRRGEGSISAHVPGVQGRQDGEVAHGRVREGPRADDQSRVLKRRQTSSERHEAGRASETDGGKLCRHSAALSRNKQTQASVHVRQPCPPGTACASQCWVIAGLDARWRMRGGMHGGMRGGMRGAWLNTGSMANAEWGAWRVGRRIRQGLAKGRRERGWWMQMRGSGYDDTGAIGPETSL
eukprot:3763179-Rhodomonas_salina.2